MNPSAAQPALSYKDQCLSYAKYYLDQKKYYDNLMSQHQSTGNATGVAETKHQADYAAYSAQYYQKMAESGNVAPSNFNGGSTALQQQQQQRYGQQQQQQQQRQSFPSVASSSPLVTNATGRAASGNPASSNAHNAQYVAQAGGAYYANGAGAAQSATAGAAGNEVVYVPAVVPTESNDSVRRAKRLEIWGNDTTMNFSGILYENIKKSLYFVQLCNEVPDFDMALPELAKVEYLEPWIGGTRNPSSAFCLLYKLFTLRLTERQINSLLHRQENVYARCIALLYCRFSLPPAQQWSYYRNFLDDDTPFKLRYKGEMSTISLLTRTLIRDQKFCEVILPRIPVLMQREWLEKIKQHDQQRKRDLGDDQDYSAEHEVDRREQHDRHSSYRQCHREPRREREEAGEDSSRKRKRDKNEEERKRSSVEDEGNSSRKDRRDVDDAGVDDEERRRAKKERKKEKKEKKRKKKEKSSRESDDDGGVTEEKKDEKKKMTAADFLALRKQMEKKRKKREKEEQAKKDKE